MVPGESNLEASTPGSFFTHKPETAVSSVATNMLTSGPAGGRSHPKGPFVGDCWWGVEENGRLVPKTIQHGFMTTADCRDLGTKAHRQGNRCPSDLCDAGHLGGREG